MCRAKWLIALLIFASYARAADYFVYVGTYTSKDSEGIYAWRFHSETGKLSPVGMVAKTINPAFLAVHPNRHFLYAVNETANGSVSAFAMDRATGKLTPLNTVSSRGPGPCHLTLDKTGRCLIIANYSGGSVAAFPVAKNGRLGDATSFFQHSGTVALPQRQGGPHAHAALASPDNRYALIADLGLDEVLVYRLNAAKASLTPNDPPFAKVAPGSGPRHLAFHPNGRLLYLLNEIKSTVAVFSYVAKRGELQEIQTVSALPKDFQGVTNAAEIVVHPSGKFLYSSNRGHDSIAVFAVDPKAGTLTLIEHVSTQGKVPRNFAIDPTGSYLFAANQNSDNVVLFRINRQTGRLMPTGEVLSAPRPTCVIFLPAK